MQEQVTVMEASQSGTETLSMQLRCAFDALRLKVLLIGVHISMCDAIAIQAEVTHA